MNTPSSKKWLIILMGVLWLWPLDLTAADLSGHEQWYDVKSSFHFKIGYYSVKIYPAGDHVYKMEGKFHLSYKKLFSKYVYSSTDSVMIDGRGVVSYEIDENKDGQLRHISAVRKDGILEVTTWNKKGGIVHDRNSVRVADYDYTQYETRFPMAFARFQVGQVKRSRVWNPTKNRIVISDVEAQEIKNVTWEGETRRVLVLETTAKEDEKTTTRTTSWLVDNGGLLFHEGTDFSLHRTTREKALNIR